MRLIGITGKAGSGKDTIAERAWTEGYVRMAFADPLKEAARVTFGLSFMQVHDRDLKEVVIPYWGMSPREMLQKFGTESIRNVFGAEVWIKRWEKSYDLIKDTDKVIVTDVRFDNEAAAIRRLGGIIIEVQRGKGLDGETATHASERGLSEPADIVIHNHGTREELYARVDELLESL